MSEQTLRVSRSLDVPAAMPWLVAIAVYLLLMVLGNRLLGDADTYWHITLGRLILEHRALPTGEALSQTAVHAARPLAPLRQTPLPAGAALPVPASLLLEPQAANVGGGAAAGEESVRAAAGADGHRFERELGRAVAVLRGKSLTRHCRA
jgi:hypothetical protein